MICKIRKWNLADAADLAMVLSNRKVQDNLRDGLPYPYTEQDGVDYISAMLSADENETFAFAISADGRVVGSIGVFRQGNIHRQTAELGYCIAEGYWGKGIMTEAYGEVLRFLFEEAGFYRIGSSHAVENPASGKVMEKCGLRSEGTKRKSFRLLSTGEWTDIVVRAILEEDYFARK